MQLNDSFMLPGLVRATETLGMDLSLLVFFCQFINKQFLGRIEIIEAFFSMFCFFYCYVRNSFLTVGHTAC